MKRFRLVLLCILCVCYTGLLALQDTVHFVYFTQKTYPEDKRFPHRQHGWFFVEELPPNLGKSPCFTYSSRLYHGLFWFDATHKPDTLSISEYRRYKSTTPEVFFKKKGWDLSGEEKVFNKEANNNVQYYLFKRHKQHYLRYSLDSVYYHAYPTL